MDCIQTSNKAVDLFGAGKHGFAPGNPGAGVLATYFSPAWANGVQEEILTVIRAAGLVPSGADLTQLLQAINVLFGAYALKPGDIVFGTGTSVRPGTVRGVGALLSRAAYPGLFTFAQAEGLISEAAWSAGEKGRYSVGDGATTFRTPDFRGVFFRGWDNGGGADTGRVVGSTQAGQNASHTHGVNDAGHGHGVNDPSHFHIYQKGPHDTDYQPGTVGYGSFGGGTPDDPGYLAQTSPVGTGISIVASGTGISIQSSGGTEVRVINIAVPVFIKY